MLLLLYVEMLKPYPPAKNCYIRVQHLTRFAKQYTCSENPKAFFACVFVLATFPAYKCEASTNITLGCSSSSCGAVMQMHVHVIVGSQ